MASKRPNLEDLDLSLGKRTRLYRLLYKYGPGNGTMLLLPIDHGLEHGPRDFLANPLLSTFCLVGDSELDLNHPASAFRIWWQSGRRSVRV